MPALSHRHFLVSECHLALTTGKEQLQACIPLKVVYFQLYVFLPVCWYVHMSSDACEGQKRVSDVL